ncbi:MAG: TIGR01244 family sulfur transferase [Parerythrobacter sp.]
MTAFRTLTDSMLVSGQIAPADLATAAAQGVTLVINNRPDKEEGGQPDGAQIESAATAAGLSYRAIPVAPGRMGPEQIDAMANAMDAAEGPVLAFCRTGTRSTFLWALAQASRGTDPDALASAAQGAGYDLSPIRSTLDAMAKG